MAGTRVRVLLVGRGAPESGGIAAFLAMLLGSRLTVDHDVAFLNLAPPERGSGGRVDGTNLRRTARDVARVWHQAAGRDVVHLHSALAPLPTLVRAGAMVIAARARGARVIVHVHGGRVPGWLDSPRHRRAARALLRPADVIVAVSTGTRDALVDAVGATKVVLVENGIEPGAEPAERHATGEAPVILFVGALTERKGAIDLLAASASLASEGVAHRLWLIGGTSDDGAAAELAVRAAAAPDAELLGQLPHDEVLTRYRQADLFCLPSWWEAMPLSILEAMAAGLPVVATRVGDVPRLVEDGATGILVDVGDRAALADALRLLLTDPARRRALGAAGRTTVVERFDLARTVAAIEGLYCGLAGVEPS